MDSLRTDKSFLIVGCGGLGCNVAESLLRFGAGSVTICDGDRFEASNMNRQLYATHKTLGSPKVLAAAKRAEELCSPGYLIAINEFFTKDNAQSLLEGIDIVIDALDNIESRLLLEDECAKCGIPIVHGAVSGWIYQIALAMPGAGLLHKLYGHIDLDKEAHSSSENYSFMVQLCAAKQAAEAVKLALGLESRLVNTLLICDEESGEEQLLRFDGLACCI